MALVVDRDFIREPNLLLPNKKPVGNVQINWNLSITRRLIGCWVFTKNGDYRDLVNAQPYTLVGGNDAAPISPKREGMSVEVTSDNTANRISLGSITSSNRLSGAVNNRISFYCYCNRGSSAIHGNNFPRIFDKSTGGFAANGWAVYHDFTVDGITFGVDGDVSPPASSALGFSSDENFSVGVSAINADTSFYINGKFDVSRSNSYTFPSTTCNAALLNWNHSTDRQVRSPVYCIYIWDRLLSASDHLSLHKDRYQFLISA